MSQLVDRKYACFRHKNAQNIKEVQDTSTAIINNNYNNNEVLIKHELLVYTRARRAVHKKERRRRKMLGQYNNNNKLIHGHYTSRYNLHHTHIQTQTHTHNIDPILPLQSCNHFYCFMYPITTHITKQKTKQKSTSQLLIIVYSTKKVTPSWAVFGRVTHILLKIGQSFGVWKHYWISFQKLL